MIDDKLFHDEIEASLRQATGGQLARIMMFVDRLPSRAKIDDVIAPVRGRLALARPARTATPARVLTAPLENLLAPPICESASPFLAPRDILTAFHAAAFSDFRPSMLKALDDEGQSASMDDTAAVIALGRQIWPTAAAGLRRFAAKTAETDAAAPNEIPIEAWRESFRPRLAILAELLEHGEQLVVHQAEICATKALAADNPRRHGAVEAFLAWAAASPAVVKRAAAAIALRLDAPIFPAPPAFDAETTAEAVNDLVGEMELTFSAKNIGGYPATLTDSLLKLAKRTALIGVYAANQPDLLGRLENVRAAAVQLATNRLSALLNERNFAESFLANAAGNGKAKQEDAADAESLARTAAKIADAIKQLHHDPAVASAILEPWIGKLRAAAQARPIIGDDWRARFSQHADYLRLIEILSGPERAVGEAQLLDAWPSDDARLSPVD